MEGQQTPELSENWLQHFFENCRFNHASIRSIKKWFPTSPDEVTFRIATDDEILILSFPKTWQTPERE